jgi:hypothetical protein
MKKYKHKNDKKFSGTTLKTSIKYQAQQHINALMDMMEKHSIIQKF